MHYQQLSNLKAVFASTLLWVVALTTLLPDPAVAQEMPPWLQEREQPVSSSSPTAVQERGAGRVVDQSEKTLEERQRTSVPDWWTGGPFIEETVISPSGAPAGMRENQRETVAERAQRFTKPMNDTPEFDAGPQADDRYVVQPSDVLTVSVWREPNLEREVTVSPDGWITYPLVGDLNVENQTLASVRDLLEKALSRLINKPAVHVGLKFAAGNRIYVLGKVNNPGVFPFSKNLDVVQALSLAGGVSRFADMNSIRIIRRIGEEQQAFRFNYSRVSRGRGLEQNIFLRSGDVVMVP